LLYIAKQFAKGPDNRNIGIRKHWFRPGGFIPFSAKEALASFRSAFPKLPDWKGSHNPTSTVFMIPKQTGTPTARRPYGISAAACNAHLPMQATFHQVKQYCQGKIHVMQRECPGQTHNGRLTHFSCGWRAAGRFIREHSAIC